MSQHEVCVLVVEDNRLSQKIAEHVLRSMGIKFDVVENGQEACEIFLDRKYDLVLMDCQMEVMDGYVATRKIRESSELGQKVPVVAITANATWDVLERCKSAGMTDFVAKPFSIQGLKTIILRNLEKNPLEQQ